MFHFDKNWATLFSHQKLNIDVFFFNETFFLSYAGFEVSISAATQVQTC